MNGRAWGTSLGSGLLVSLFLGALVVVGQAPASAVTAPTDFESRLLTHINNHRAAIGCGRLSYNPYLAYAARRHTSKMVSARTLSHQLAGEPSLGSRITTAGYTGWTLAAENIAYGTTTPWATYSLWMRSAGHRANIENCRLRNAGIGATLVNGKSWDTLDFGRQ